jgi:hypothetical protein
MSADLVSVNGQDVPVIYYRGHRVITLAQMDVLHQRREGTSKRNFAEHQSKLITGEDYFRIGPSELGELETKYEIRTYSVGRGGKMILLTRDGYLLLVKAFQDDLAWQVQRELVNGYFDHRQKSSADLTPWLCFDPRPWEQRFPPEFYTEVLRLKRRELDDDRRTERWWGHITIDLVYSRIAPGVREGLNAANPIPAGGKWRRHKHHQHFPEGGSDRKLTSLIGECIGVMRHCNLWGEFHVFWNAIHPRCDALQAEFSFIYSDARLLMPWKPHN